MVHPLDFVKAVNAPSLLFRFCEASCTTTAFTKMVYPRPAAALACALLLALASCTSAKTSELANAFLGV